MFILKVHAINSSCGMNLIKDDRSLMIGRDKVDIYLDICNRRRKGPSHILSNITEVNLAYME